MPLTNLEQQLRPIARERIANGQLPRKGPSQMWGGFGTGQLCALCDKPIERYQMGYEFDLKGATVLTFRFHTNCQSIWQIECARDLSEEGRPGG